MADKRAFPSSSRMPPRACLSTRATKKGFHPSEPTLTRAWTKMTWLMLKQNSLKLTSCRQGRVIGSLYI